MKMIKLYRKYKKLKNQKQIFTRIIKKEIYPLELNTKNIQFFYIIKNIYINQVIKYVCRKYTWKNKIYIYNSAVNVYCHNNKSILYTSS